LLIKIAPANEAIEYEEFDFDNDFAHQTVYRGVPNPELEKACDRLWLCKSDLAKRNMANSYP
jgi:hypothetical protein